MKLSDIDEIIIDSPDAIERRDGITEWADFEQALNDSGVSWRVTKRPISKHIHMHAMKDEINKAIRYRRGHDDTDD